VGNPTSPRHVGTGEAVGRGGSLEIGNLEYQILFTVWALLDRSEP